MSDVKQFFLFFSVIASLLVGCNKKDAAGNTGPIPSPDVPPPAAVAAVAENAPRANVTGQPDAFLTGQLQAFVKSKGRMPGNFTEFARQLVSIPKPPAGTKWVLDSADQSVKAVAQ